MSAHGYRRQFQTVLLIELAIIGIAVVFAASFWSISCDESWQSCLGEADDLAPGRFLFLSAIRPYLLTPMTILSLVAGDAFGPYWGAIYIALGATFSALTVYLPAKLLGNKLVTPWLSANLPATWQLLRTQDFKVILALRLIPILPFDILSLLFGAVDFRLKNVLLLTFIGTLPEAILLSQFTSAPQLSSWNAMVRLLSVLGALTVVSLLFYEYLSRKNGTGLWVRLRRMYDEIIYEVRQNNDIVKRFEFKPDATPVLLLYGFFSSRRSLTILERLLTAQGFQVLSFNLGGLLGVFFTRSIIDTATFIDFKLKRQFNRHNYRKIHIVAHSKGGLVALWWLLRMGGHQYCDRLITMGTPYRGSIFTYLALITPLGFLWRDVWQMRPGSEFLHELRQSPIPEHVKIFCMYSDKDRVAKGENGLLQPDSGPRSNLIVPIPMHHVAHFEFLSRRDVSKTLGQILREGDVTPLDQPPPREESDQKTPRPPLPPSASGQG